MKNFFSKLFNKSSKKEDILSFDIMNNIHNYLCHKNQSVCFKMKGYSDKIYVNRYNFPESFDNYKSKSEIKSCGYTNSYEILNELYLKLNIKTISDVEIAENDSYDYIHISFFSNIPKESGATSINVLENFIVFFCCDDDYSDGNSIRILYLNNSFFTFYTKSLLNTKFIDINKPETAIEEISFKNLKTVVIGICQFMKIEMPDLVSAENLLEEDASMENFEELFHLITQKKMDTNQVQKSAKKMFQDYKKQSNKNSFYYKNKDLLVTHYFWNSDWKFDAEEVEYFISNNIDSDFTFDYPDETHSHDLFPYIQAKLSQLDLELMSLDTQSDNYLFFIAAKCDVSRILQLSEITEVRITTL